MIFKRRKIKEKRKKIIAYDLETTKIEGGTPVPLYFTAFGGNMEISVSLSDDTDVLADILIAKLLTPENLDTFFVAWNGNHFDSYFIALSLLKYTIKNNADFTKPFFIIRPMLTKSKQLRGLYVINGYDVKQHWCFVDGIAMTGLVGHSLQKFVDTYAPHLPKLQSPDWDTEVFNSKNPEHVLYAQRDSEALYYAMVNADKKVRSIVGHGLTSTIGNLGIKYFRSQIPDGVIVESVPVHLDEAMHACLYRGGFCWAQRQYSGQVWKYDMNQAYAAAMRYTKLPCGQLLKTSVFNAKNPGVYHVAFYRDKPSSIPFYYKNLKGEGLFSNGVLDETWLCSDEIEQLKVEKWNIKLLDGYYWESFFNMCDMVDALEHMRLSDPEGVNGSTGLMAKNIGNNSYGKTVEHLGGEELIISAIKIEGYEEYRPEDPSMEHIYFKINDPDKMQRDYHQIQLACFITSHVRMVLRRGALKRAKSFLYADTDCLVFSAPVKHLDIDPKKYGAWKVECDGIEHVILGKKVYVDVEAQIRFEQDFKDKGKKTKLKPGARVKGLHINKMRLRDYQEWINVQNHHGVPPKQKQTQRQSFLKVMTGKSMFIDREREGTDFNALNNIFLSENGEFSP